MNVFVDNTEKVKIGNREVSGNDANEKAVGNVEAKSFTASAADPKKLLAALFSNPENDNLDDLDFDL